MKFHREKFCEVWVPDIGFLMNPEGYARVFAGVLVLEVRPDRTGGGRIYQVQGVGAPMVARFSEPVRVDLDEFRRLKEAQ